MNSFAQMLPLRNSNLWKGVGLGAGLVLLALAMVIPNMLRGRMSAHKVVSDAEDYMMVAGGGGGGGGIAAKLVEADGPKIVRSAELNLQVADCPSALKRIEELASGEQGFIEASTLEENSARITVRVPSAKLDEMRAKLREFALRVTQDSVGASDVSRQYFDREARLRNLRAQEQQFLEIMKKAHTVPDVLAVTKSLDDVRGQIEQEDGEFRRLKEQVDMAKIEVHMRSQSTSAVHWSAGGSMRSAWEDFLQSLAGLGDFLIWLLVNIPLIIFWIVTVFVLVAAGWFVLRTAIRAMRAIFGPKGGVEPVKA
jgi:Domain of unknown function (DUF4349)